MGKPADDDMAAMVRAVLPKPEGVLWQIDVVDGINDAGVELTAETATIRIQKSWRQTVHDAGLYYVARHYPLALEPVDDQKLPTCLLHRPVNLWRGVALEWEYSSGRFTGRLLADDGACTYVARTFDRLGAAADQNIVTAARSALSERGKKLNTARVDAKRRAELRRQTRELLLTRLLCGRRYDSGHNVLLDPFRPYLPSRIAKLLEHYGNETVPLIELEQQCAEALLEVPECDIASLIYQLDVAIDAARKQFMPPWECLSQSSCAELTSEEKRALQWLAQYRANF